MKNILSILLVIAVMGVGARAEAQQPAKVARIGYLNAVSPSTVSDRIESLPSRTAGTWLRSKNIFIEYRYAEGN